MGDEDEAPDMRSNKLRSRKLVAAVRAEAAPGNLRPGGGNLVGGILETLASAWISPSYTRTRFSENLEGAGSAIKGAFDSQGSLCRSEYHAEPALVDANDPYEGWKAFDHRIDARVNYGGPR